uniref:Hyaluronidase n=1 Tax=Moschus moschiferus TaxID=68415 RepID=A0A8C6FTL7_MOSMO
MRMLRHHHISFRSSVGSSGAPQAVFFFLLLPCCLALDFRAPPLISNTSFLWAWNAPVERCVNKRFQLPPDLRLFSVKGSPQKSATGQFITLFYADRLGYYPHIDEKTGNTVHGGIPQLGNLKNHLEKAKTDIAYYIPNDSVGLAVIDWENWRPTWARNWKPKDVYKDESVELVLQKNPQLSFPEASKIAKEDFETAGKSFMQETLKLGKLLRPNHLWGYYLFPDCYNHNYNHPTYSGNCSDLEKRRNDNLNWLWKESTALFPSVYLNIKLKSTPKAAFFVRNRVQEAIRLSKIVNVESPLPVFVYARPVFTDGSSTYLSQVSKSSKGVKLSNYLNTTLNPYIINVTLAAKMCSQVLCHDEGVCTRKHWNSSDYLHLNPVNSAIQTGKGGKYTVSGKVTLEDLQMFSDKFYCSCYANIHCKKRADIKNVHGVNVCMAEDICIEGPMKLQPNDHASSENEASTTTFSSISPSTTTATVSPCTPKKQSPECLKARCLEATSNATQVGCQSVKQENTSHQSRIQNLKNQTTY